MQLPVYLYAENKEEFRGIGLLLSTRKPYNVAKPIRFSSNNSLEDFIIKYNLFGKCCRVEGYNILVVWIGTIDNVSETIPLGTKVTQEIYEDIKAMTKFYEGEKITGNESRLKKYFRE